MEGVSFPIRTDKTLGICNLEITIRSGNAVENAQVNAIQTRLFLCSCGQGGGLIVPPFENHVPLVLTDYY